MTAPAYDNSINAWSASNVASLTSAAFAVSGANRFMVGFIASGAGSPADPSGMKWGGSGGTGLTKQGATLSFGTYFKLSCYTLLAPAAQTSTLYGNWPSNQDETIIGCVSATGVDQAASLGTIGTGTGTNLSPSVNVTTAVDDFVVDCVWAGDTGGFGRTLTAGANQISRQEVEGANPTIYEAFGMSTEVATGTTTTMSWALSGTGSIDGWGIFAVPLKPAAGGGGGGFQAAWARGANQIIGAGRV